MFKKKFRLPRGIKFNNSRFVSTPFFTIKTEQSGLLLNRFLIVVSKKIDKRAVVRNRIRRIINSCIEELYRDLKQGHDMIIVVKIKAVGADREKICHEINHGLRKVALFR